MAPLPENGVVGVMGKRKKKRGPPVHEVWRRGETYAYLNRTPSKVGTHNGHAAVTKWSSTWVVTDIEGKTMFANTASGLCVHWLKQQGFKPTNTSGKGEP